MCVHVFSPGRSLQVDFASEAINLERGGKESIIDLLITNHSPQAVERLHIVYPHPIPASPHPTADPASVPAFNDLTQTWLDAGSNYNRFYESSDRSLERIAGVGKTQVVVNLANPNDITKRLPYRGYVRGEQRLSTFALSDGDVLTDRQWQILTSLGWSVFTIAFDLPIEPTEPRWLRILGRTGRLPANSYAPIEHWARWLTGILADSFEILGPENLRQHLRNSLVTAGAQHARSPATQFSLGELHTLQTRLLDRGLDVPSTMTTIKDWRLNLMQRRYRRLAEPIADGDLRSCGPLLNVIHDDRGKPLTVYQWKAGTDNVDPAQHGGQFLILATAHDIPIIAIVLPWLSLIIGLSGLTLGLINFFSR